MQTRRARERTTLAGKVGGGRGKVGGERSAAIGGRNASGTPRRFPRLSPGGATGHADFD